jgi:hypothetical protein
MKPCVIKQPAGIGDVFFCQKIARLMMNKGYQVIWPLRPDIAWIGNYIKDINFPTVEDNFPGKDIFDSAAGYVIEENGAFISLATADMTHNDGNNMRSKYSMLGIDYTDWRNYFIFERNIDKENELYYNVLGLNDDSEFVFINNLYNTDIRNSNILLENQFDKLVVELKVIDGFTLFDWCKVLEKAKEIHTIVTSINFIIDVIDTSCEKYVIYCHDEKQKLETEILFNKSHLMKCK